MATTIKSTALDFRSIKNNLKTFLSEKEEFSDYNFEASGLSNILDVLAYNTHYNALLANFSLNESYLTTAQLRNSVVSIAESLGYIPNSKTASQAVIRLVVNLTDRDSNRPSRISLPPYTTFSTSVDGITYTFQTIETLVADDENGIYRFYSEDSPEQDVTIYEGLYKEKTFIVGQQSETTVYVIPDEEIDVDTAVVKVFSSPSTENNLTFTNLIKANTISQDSALYVLKESPNEFYELSFGIGGSFGRQPVAGNKIAVEYLRASGAEANGAAIFTAIDTLFIDEIGEETSLIATTTSISAGGSNKEGIESIRKNAPFQYASQNRMVTALDYSALILKNFSSFIEDIKSWGGEDNDKPDYGAVYSSIRFKEGLTQGTINATKKKIEDLAKQLSIVSFDLYFADPEITFVQCNTVFQFNPSLTGLSKNTVVSDVSKAIFDYFKNNTGRFDEIFRRSNMLTLVDAVDASVLSSRAEIKMQKRIFPVFTLPQSFSISFPVPIESPTTTTKTVYDETVSSVTNNFFEKISSSLFVINNRTVAIRNTLNRKVRVSTSSTNSNKFQVVPTTNLEIYDVSNGKVIIDSIGFYEPATGRVVINSLEIQSIIGGRNFIKIIAIPANQSVLPVVRNQVVEFDVENSSSSATIVSTT